VLPRKAEAEIKPAEPDQGNACAGRLFQFAVGNFESYKGLCSGSRTSNLTC
jgi:hypothetical protein